MKKIHILGWSADQTLIDEVHAISGDPGEYMKNWALSKAEELKAEGEYIHSSMDSSKVRVRLYCMKESVNDLPDVQNYCLNVLASPISDYPKHIQRLAKNAIRK